MTAAASPTVIAERKHRRRALSRPVVAGLAVGLAAMLAGCGLPQDKEPQRFALSARDEQALREPITTTTLGPARTVPQDLYLVKAGGDPDNGDADMLVKVTVPVRESGRPEDVPKAVLEQLLKGATTEQRAAELRSFVPEGTQVDSVTVENGVATVNFSNLGNSIESRGQRLAAAQIVFTLTELPGVDSVRFLTRGQPANVPLGNTESSQPGQAISRMDYPKLNDALVAASSSTEAGPDPSTTVPPGQ